MLELKTICQEFKSGQGLMCLFSGARGTGQTLAAQAIARQLGLALVHVDLSALVSKYTGQTEKNLQRVFDSANPQDSLLFFDEADALFGKRTEVNDSHDRYANIDTKDLLQRIEAFQGLVILASNMKQALDSAFVRRIRHVIDFPAGDPVSPDVCARHPPCSALRHTARTTSWPAVPTRPKGRWANRLVSVP